MPKDHRSARSEELAVADTRKHEARSIHPLLTLSTPWAPFMKIKASIGRRSRCIRRRWMDTRKPGAPTIHPYSVLSTIYAYLSPVEVSMSKWTSHFCRRSISYHHQESNRSYPHCNTSRCDTSAVLSTFQQSHPFTHYYRFVLVAALPIRRSWYGDERVIWLVNRRLQESA